MENARIYTQPEEPVPILLAASGPQGFELAGRIGDGVISLSPDVGLLERFQASGGQDKPQYAQVTVCWAEDETKARRTAFEWWPTAALRGELNSELPLPRHFEQAAKVLREEDVAQVIICGPDPDQYIKGIKKYTDTGYDHIYSHQVGPDQEGFFRFYEREVLPRLDRMGLRAKEPPAA